MKEAVESKLSGSVEFRILGTGRETRSFIYIDDFTETFLNALNAYYNDDYNILDGLCDQLNNMISADDRNNQDKLFLLCARAAQNRGNISKAKEYYQNLVSNPLFNEEVQELLK
jgi:hypothetical protein